MQIDNNLYFVKTTGLKDATAWTSLWAAVTNYSDAVDLAAVTNRKWFKNGFIVFQVGTTPTQAANTSTFNVITSANANLTSPDVIWSSGALANTVVNAWPANSIVLVVPIPPVIGKRYLGVNWVLATSAWTTGTMNIYWTDIVPVPYSNVQ